MGKVRSGCPIAGSWEEARSRGRCAIAAGEGFGGTLRRAGPQSGAACGASRVADGFHGRGNPGPEARQRDSITYASADRGAGKQDAAAAGRQQRDQQADQWDRPIVPSEPEAGEGHLEPSVEPDVPEITAEEFEGGIGGQCLTVQLDPEIAGDAEAEKALCLSHWKWAFLSAFGVVRTQPKIQMESPFSTSISSQPRGSSDGLGLACAETPFSTPVREVQWRNPDRRLPYRPHDRARHPRLPRSADRGTHHCPGRRPAAVGDPDAGQGPFDPQVQLAPDYEFDQRIAW